MCVNVIVLCNSHFLSCIDMYLPEFLNSDATRTASQARLTPLKQDAQTGSTRETEAGIIVPPDAEVDSSGSSRERDDPVAAPVIRLGNAATLVRDHEHDGRHEL